MIDVPEECIKAWKEGYETASDYAKRQTFEAEMARFVWDQEFFSAMDQALIERGYTPATGASFQSGYLYHDIAMVAGIRAEWLKEKMH